MSTAVDSPRQAVPARKASRESGLRTVLAVNGGSSTIRFSFFSCAAGSEIGVRLASGKLDRIGMEGASLKINGTDGKTILERPIGRPGAEVAEDVLTQALEGLSEFSGLVGVGHRVVQGMNHVDSERVTEELLSELSSNRWIDPDHLPEELALIHRLTDRHPKLPQVACFDTAFHRTMPRVATLLPLPRRYDAQGIRRYGYHGISYSYLMEELTRIAGEERSHQRVILAHLGSGASMAAVLHGESIDTSMGFTPASGLVMSTRTGDIDPGIVGYLAHTEHMSPARFQAMINHESGLLGVSESSSDMRDLLKARLKDERAADAVDLFCYQAKKWIGAYAASLGGLDTLVFTGGIGENAPAIRKQICEGLEFLGIHIDGELNSQNADLISENTAPVAVRVIRTDEERMIARSTARLVGISSSKEG